MERMPTGETGEVRHRTAARGGIFSSWGWPRSMNEVRFRHVAVLLLLGLTVWGYVDVRVRGRVVPGRVELHRTDFTVYTEAGAAFFDGRDPYRVTNPRGWFYLYPPLLALLVSPLSAFDGPTQVSVWYAISVAAAFGCYFEGRRLWLWLCPENDDPSRVGLGRAVGACAGLAVLFPTLECLQRGQVGVVLLYFLLLGFRLVVQGERWPAWLLGGVVLALPAVIKLIPALPVGFLLLQRWAAVLADGPRGRTAARAGTASLGVAAGGFLFLFLIPSACLGWGKNLDHLRTWTGRVVANPDVDHAAGFNIYSHTNQSFANAAHLAAVAISGTRLNGIPPEARMRVVLQRQRIDRTVRAVVWGLRGAAALLLLALGFGSIRARWSPQADLAAFGLACAMILVVSPLSWTHYYMMLLPAVLGAALWLAAGGVPGSARVAAAIPAVLCVAHYAGMWWPGTSGLLGLGTTAWVFGMGLWIVTDTFSKTRQDPCAMLRGPSVRTDRRVRLARFR